MIYFYNKGVEGEEASECNIALLDAARRTLDAGKGAHVRWAERRELETLVGSLKPQVSWRKPAQRHICMQQRVTRMTHV